jgi:hypothetical protein
MAERPGDLELVEAFLNQEDRRTHSGLMLSDCFSYAGFELAFEYGTVVQRSAVRQGLIACLSLPSFDPQSEPPARNTTFEKHLENLLIYVWQSITDDESIRRDDRATAALLFDTAVRRRDPRELAPIAESEPPGESDEDVQGRE